MIDVNNLKISFDEKVVIDGIDFSVDKGSSLVLLGKNGSGKSVVLKTIAGLIEEYEGDININGENIQDFFQDRDIRFKGDLEDFRLTYVFQKGGLFDSMNVYDNVSFGLRRLGVDENEIEDIVKSSLTRVGLSGSEEKLPSELSGGMQKRVGLARAVCMSPNVILFDDPTAGLDPILSDSIADMIIEIRDSLHTTSIIVTQDLKVAEKVADKVGLLYEGKLVYNGTCDEFFAEADEFSKQFIEGDIEGPIDIF